MASDATIGIDLGGTNIKGGVIDAAGELVHRRSIETQAALGFQHVFDRLVGLIADLRHDAAGMGGQILRSAQDDAVIGIGVPGPMSHKEGFIYGAPNLPGWVNIPLRKLLHEATGARVSVENDANAAAFGEFTAGAGRGVPEMVMLTLGTGIGGGVIMNGQLQRGHFDNAGEVGHMIVVAGGRECPCGQRGCLERYASASAVGERLVEALRRGESSSLSGKVGGDDSIDASEVAAAALTGDALATRIWDEACRFLAIACVNLQHVLNPKRIVFTGGMIAAGDQLFACVREHFATLAWNVARDFPEIVPATLGGDAGVIGAAALAQRDADTILR